MDKDKMIKDPNELHVNIEKRENKEVLFDSDCCSCMSLVLTADGKLATSFFGLHTPEIIKIMKHNTNQYYAKLIKEYNKQFKEEENRRKSIKLVQGKNPNIDDKTLEELNKDLENIKNEETKKKPKI